MSLLLLLLGCAGPADSEDPTGLVLGDPLDLPGQGLSAEELPRAQALAASLLADPSVAAVVWRVEGTRDLVLTTAAGPSPLETPGLPDDPTFATTYEAELAAGSNPESTTLPGYPAGDPRLSFIETEDGSFPFLTERLTQLFDHPDSPDLAYILAPYASGGVGIHGGLSAAQSRAPLVLRGPGVLPGRHALGARHVDIAPTVAELLGVALTEGVYQGYEASGVLLRWQDGDVLTPVLSADARGAASHAAVFILDGLSHTELLHALETEDLPSLSALVEGGAVLEHGSVVGFPSWSFPGHVSIHTGAWQGHHGVLSNRFWHRAGQALVPAADLPDLLIDAQAAQDFADAHLSPQVETLFEAVLRTWPEAHTASVSELTFRGATRSRLLGGAPRADLTLYEAADALTVFDAARLWEPTPPKFLAASFYLTDAAGQAYGPHADDLREALRATDARLGQVLDLYREAGLFDDTLFVLTADHGMELQDPARQARVSAAIAASGVEVIAHGGGLLTLR